MPWLTIFSFSSRPFRSIASDESNPRSEERRNRLNNTNIIEQYDLLASVRSQPSLTVVEAQGAGFKDDTGKEYVNLNEINRQLGYSNLHFTNVIKDCLESAAPEKTSVYKNNLYHHIVESTNNDFQRILLTSSGSEAVEWAIRVARKRTGRYDIVSFWNSIHGRTYLASSVSGNPVRKTGYGPLAPGVVFAPYPYCYRCPFDETPERCNLRCLEFLKQKITNESSQEVAAVIVEPFQGAGIIFPPDGYLKALRTWTSQSGIELILDEVQSGLGRLGHMYEYQRLGIVPDALLLGKGMGNGLHISAMLLKDTPEADPRIMTGGSGDVPLSCAGACAVFEELKKKVLLENVNQVGAYWNESLTELAGKYPCIGNVRGRGAAFAIELITDQETKKENNRLREKVVRQLQDHGFLPGSWRSSIVLRPPLSITLEQAERFVWRLEQILEREGN